MGLESESFTGHSGSRQFWCSSLSCDLLVKPFSSKHVFQRKLDFAHVGGRARDSSQSRAGEAGAGQREIRVVGEVERLEAKLQVLVFYRGELLGHREIPAQQTRAGEGISSEIAEGIGRW